MRYSKVFLALLVTVCGLALAQQSGDVENLVFGEENLTFPDDDDSTGAENLVFEEAFDEPEPIPAESLVIPETDRSRATPESEPNNDHAEAQKLDALPAGSTGSLEFSAVGVLAGRDADFYSFTVPGESQLFLIEVLGPDVDRVTLFESAGRLAYARRADGGWSLTGMHLLPGDYQISVEQHRDDGDADYFLRIVSLGAPDPTMENEPNDTIDVAEVVGPAFGRKGVLAEPGDVDYYRFSVSAPQLIRIRVDPPPDLKLYFALKDGRSGMVSRTAKEAGEAIEYTAMLQPGNYHVELKPRDSSSTTTYGITITTGGPYDRRVDLEPNDKPHQARALPGDGVVRGRARDFGDSDWYRLPGIATSTALKIHSPAGRQRLSLQSEESRKLKRHQLDWSEETSNYTATLEPGLAYVIEVGTDGEYEFTVSLVPGAKGAARRSTIPGIRLQVRDELAPFAAYWHTSQTADISLLVRNEGDSHVSAAVEAVTNDPGWTVLIPGTGIEVAPRSEVRVPLRLDVAPDAQSGRPVRVDFNVVDTEGRNSVASATTSASCGAAPVGPGDIWTLPETLLGGFNVAWSGLGASFVGESGQSRGKVSEGLHDGITRNDGGWILLHPEFPVDLTFRLAGAEPVAIAGIVLSPQGNYPPNAQVRDFELLLSEDGAAFDRVLSGRLSRAKIPQTFVLPQSTNAAFARLRILSVFDPTLGRVGLGEIAVIASPSADPFPDHGFNLANPALGGYVVWSRPNFSNYGSAEAILTEAEERPKLRVDPVRPTEWVLGFHHDRAAQISQIQWSDPAGDQKSRRMKSVRVSASLDSPIGPWSPLGNWSFDRQSGPDFQLEFDKPVWARYVRFVSADTDYAGNVEVAETIRILERSSDAEYRSILAEWGPDSRDGFFEALQAARVSADGSVMQGRHTDRDRALVLQSARRYVDAVQRGNRRTWYRFDVPAGDNRLRFEIEGMPVANVGAVLETANSDRVVLEEIPTKGNQQVLEAQVEGGTSYWLRLEEPMRHLVLVWDNSGSVSPFYPAIYASIYKFVRDIQPGHEFVQLLPFREPGFLLEDWTDQKEKLLRGLQNYPRKDSSSDAEEFLMRASGKLGTVEGTRAAIIVTDAETGSYRTTPELWDTLTRVRPRVFSVELHRGTKAAHQQDLMQSWASVNHGYYSRFSELSDLDTAFDRAFCHLRRPVRFSLVADSRFEEPPGPGWLNVDAEKAISANAVELILDASGSMLQRLDGTRRIEIARTVLTDLVNETIPEGTSLALRIFGHRKPDACDTDLALPLQPLDRDKVAGIIQSTQAMNLARTPIGDSLARVADDLRGVDGQKLVVLITDGEETCDGDPAAEIKALKEAGHDVRLNIVGFAIDDAALKAEFESWARMGGGLYFNANSAEELDEALKEAMRPKFQVLNDAGDIVANGTTGGAALELPSAVYTVRILTSPTQTFTDVSIKPEETTRVSAEAN